MRTRRTQSSHAPGPAGDVCEVAPGISVTDLTAALDAIDAWHEGSSNRAVRIIQQATGRGAVPGLIAALVWITTEVLNEYAGERAAEWQASLRARIEAAASEGAVL